MNGKRVERPPGPVAEIVRTASLLVSCIACGKLHKPESPLDLTPVCAACTGRYTTASLDMGRCYPLTEEKIDEVVSQTSAGNYTLGYLNGSTFVPLYLGRSDSDVRGCLHSWTGVDGRYTDFEFSYAASAKAAFEKECRSYHDFGGSYGLDNEHHPAAAERVRCICPVDGRHQS